MYIDTHVQLNFSDFDEDRVTVISNAKKTGVKQFIVPGVDHNSCRTALHLAKTHPGVIFAAVGYHPYEAPKNPDLSYVETLLNDPDNKNFIVAVGECGLDYHEYRGEVAAGRKEVQERLFTDQLMMAVRFDLPVIIHCREAFDDVFSILQKLPAIPRGVFHCFSGSRQDLRIAVDMGFFIGVDGNVTYSKQLPMVIPFIPVDSLLLETDAPYLTPVPHRGKRNEPKYIPLVAAKVAELQKKPLDEIMTATTVNAQRLFSL